MCGGVDETFFEVKFKCVGGLALSSRCVHVVGGVGEEGGAIAPVHPLISVA